MDLTHVPLGSIVVGVDGSPSADLALAWAADVAERERRPLVLLHAASAYIAWSGGGGEVVALRDAIDRDARTVLTHAETRAREGRDLVQVMPLYDFADPRQALVDVSRRAHVLVVGSRGRGRLQGLLLGSVSTSASTRADCPVVVVRATGPTSGPARVVAGVDGGPAALPVLEFAFDQAAERDLPLTVVHRSSNIAEHDQTEPADLEGTRLLLAESVAGLGVKYPDVEVDLDVAHRLEQLPEHIFDDAALVVVGRLGTRTLTHLLHDSVARWVVEHAPCPVAVVPSRTTAEDSARSSA